PPGTVILGGGAYVEWDGPCAAPNPAGNLITGMFPNEEGTIWTVKAKDHLVPSPASVVAYCIVAQTRDQRPINPAFYKIVSKKSLNDAHPHETVSLPEGFTVVGGGANVDYQGLGSMLFECYPTPGLDGWVGSAKDHLQPDPSPITVWAIGLNT